MDDPDIAPAREDQGVQFPQEGVEIGRLPAGELQDVPVFPEVGKRGNPGMEAELLGSGGKEGCQEGDHKKDMAFHHLSMLCSTSSDGSVFRRS